MIEIPLHANKSNTELFAYDATQYESGNTFDEVEDKLTNEAVPLVNWCIKNSMVLSEENPKRWLLPLPKNTSNYAKSRFLSTVPLSNLFLLKAFLALFSATR